MSGRPAPTLALSPSAAPLTPVTQGSVRSRPGGARRRLQIANPDESESDNEASRVSPVRQSPVRASTGGGQHPHAPSGLGRNFSSSTDPEPSPGPAPVPIPKATGASSAQPPSMDNAYRATGSIINGHSPAGLSGSPNATRQQPLPPQHAPYNSPPPPLSGGGQPRPPLPQPPPQPERHRLAARAMTSPTTQTSSLLDPGRASAQNVPSSPSSRPPLPAAPVQPVRASTAPSPTYAPSRAGHPPPPPYHMSVQTPAIVSPPAVTSAASVSSTSIHSAGGVNRVASPDDSMLGTGGGRQRSGSVQRALVRVTTDNEQFTVADITGIQTTDGIRDRLFSKLREFRQEDYPSLLIYQTEVGEQPDRNPLGNTQLLQLCQRHGDSNGSLKFLVVQPHGQPSAQAPPTGSTRTQLHPIVTDITPAPPYSDSGSGHRSNNSSMGGSAEPMDRGSGSRTSITSIEGANMAYMRGRLGSSSSRSPMTDPPPSTSALHHPLDQRPVHTGSISSPNLPLVNPPADEDEGTYRPSHAMTGFSRAGPSSSFSCDAEDADAAILAEAANMITPDMDEETKQSMIRMCREDYNARAQMDSRRADEEADQRLAMQEQESEREVWQIMQQMELQTQAQAVQQVQQGPTPQERELLAQQMELRNQQERQQLARVAPQQPAQQVRQPTVDPQLPTTYPLQNATVNDDRASQFVADRVWRRDYYANAGVATDPWPHHGMDNRDLSTFPRRVSEQPRPTQAPHPPPPSRTNTTPSTMYNGETSSMQYHSRPPNYAPDRGQDLRRNQHVPSARPQPGQPLAYISTHQGMPPNPHRQAPGHSGMMTPLTSEPTGYQDAPYHENGSAYAGILPIQFPSPQPTQPWPTPPTMSPTRELPYQHGPARHPYTDHHRDRSGSESRIDNGHLQHDQPFIPHRRSHDRTPISRRDHMDPAPDSMTHTGTTDSTMMGPPKDESTYRASDHEYLQMDRIITGQGAVVGPHLPWGADGEGTEVPLFMTQRQAPHPPAQRQQHRVVSAGLSDDSGSGSESDSSSTHRDRVFGPSRPGNDWLLRPEPEQLYERLQEFFPKFDIDQPLVDSAVARTSTASPDWPRNTGEGHRPPPLQQPVRAQPAQPSVNDSPRNANPVYGTLQAGLHAVTSAAAAPFTKFNKSENRRSIRNVAETRARSIAKHRVDGGRDNQIPAPVIHNNNNNLISNSNANNNNNVDLRRSSSMWGHRVVEVTPSKLDNHMPVIPETSSSGPATFQWLKGDLIGKGSFGRVYVGFNLSSGDVIAVKQVKMVPGNESENKEIELLKDLYHPNIVSYLGWQQSTPKMMSIFLEYVGGGSIAAIYRKMGAFEEQLVKFFTSQILEGLAYLHNRGIWHRDLKADNILVDANGVCKITDFGISKQTSDVYNSYANQGTVMKGTWFWMAPEMFSQKEDAERSYSGKVDIWSLGCVVIEMFSAQRPWAGETQYSILHQLIAGATPNLPNGITLLPPANDFLYERCLLANPQARPTAAELAVHEFVTNRDSTWSFAASMIGEMVAKQSANPKKTLRSASTSSGRG